MGPGVEEKEAGLRSEVEVEDGREDGARPEAEAVARVTSMGMGEAVVNTTETSVILSNVQQHLYMIFFYSFFFCLFTEFFVGSVMCSASIVII